MFEAQFHQVSYSAMLRSPVFLAISRRHGLRCEEKSIEEVSRCHQQRHFMNRAVLDIYESLDESRIPTVVSHDYVLELAKHIPKRKVNVLLDLGCYDGSMTETVQGLSGSEVAIGLDFLRKRLVQARRMGIETIAVDFSQSGLPIGDETVDFVFAGDLIEHLYSPDSLLEEIWRVLKRDGQGFISTPNLGSWKCRLSLLMGYQPPFAEASSVATIGNPLIPVRPPSGHIRVMTAKALVQLLRLHKFTVLRLSYYSASRAHHESRFSTRVTDRAVRHLRPSLLDEILVSFTKD